MLSLKKSEVERRVKSLPGELARWVTLTGELGGDDPNARRRYLNAHFSQIQILQLTFKELLDPAIQQLNKLDPAGDPGLFMSSAWDLIKRTMAAQQFWDFYRDKFELRFSPHFRDALWVADTVAWDCYTAVIQAAQLAGIQLAGSVREPPLTYASADLSPLTWVRSSKPNEARRIYHLGDQERRLPFAIIQLPWESLENLWELMSLHHEVGHDLEADLDLYEPLQLSLAAALAAAGTPQDHRPVWALWMREVLADLIGLQLGGPAFAYSLASQLLLPAPLVTTHNETGPHPTHYLRIRLCARYIPTLLAAGSNSSAELQALADQLENEWLRIYGDERCMPFALMLDDFSTVFTALMDTPLAELNNLTLRGLMPYEEADHVAIRSLAAHMLSPAVFPPQAIKLRHIVSAARLAMETPAADVATVNDHVRSFMQQFAPATLRSGTLSRDCKDLADSLAAVTLTIDS